MPSAAALRLTLPTAHWMIDRVHHHPANMRAAALPARPAGFATRDVHVIDVADLANRRIGAFVNPANLARGHLYECVTTFAVIKSRLLAGAPCDLPAAA